MIKIESVCERRVVLRSQYDLDNCEPYGPSCCSECDTIIQSRAAWMTPFYRYIP